MVGDDVLGGFFALNGGRFSPEGHTIWYLAPDTLDWENLGLGYSDFLCWCFSAEVDGFYEPQRWSGWQTDVRSIDGDHGIAVYPPLTAAGAPMATRARSVVPIEELFAVHAGRSLMRP